MKLGNLLFDINKDFLILIFFSNLIWKINLNNTFAIKYKVLLVTHWVLKIVMSP